MVALAQVAASGLRDVRLQQTQVEVVREGVQVRHVLQPVALVSERCRQLKQSKSLQCQQVHSDSVICKHQHHTRTLFVFESVNCGFLVQSSAYTLTVK